MTHRKFIRVATALLMVLALTLPVASPALAGHITATSITPIFGPVTGGTLVTIIGTNFSGAAPTHICFGTVAEGVDAPALTTAAAAACPGATGAAFGFVNATTVTATTPAHAAGGVNVALRVPGNSPLWISVSGTNAHDYVYGPPSEVNIVATDSTAAEAGLDTGTFLVSRGPDTSVAVTVNYTVAGTATSGTDYAAIGTSVVIPAGAPSATITVTPIDDAFDEPNETVIVTISASPANYTIGPQGSATVTILDNDLPEVNVTATDATATETTIPPPPPVVLVDTGTFTFTRNPEADTTVPLTVFYSVNGTATSGADYAAIGTSVVILVGNTSTTRTVTPVDDAIDEPNETVRVTLTANPAYTIGASSSATVTIFDNDLPAVTIVATDPTAHEAQVPVDTGTFTVTRTAGDTTAALTVNYTVTGTATSGTDYTAIGTSVVIPAGATSATITVTPLGDDADEGDETVIVDLAASTPAGLYTIGTPSSATVTITADVPAQTLVAAPAAGRGTIVGQGLGSHIPDTIVTAFRYPRGDATDAVAGPIAVGTARSVETDAAATYVFADVAPGNYRVTTGDSRFGLLHCLGGASCGKLPATRVVTVGAGEVIDADFDLLDKTAPGLVTLGGETGVFGYVVNGGDIAGVFSLPPIPSAPTAQAPALGVVGATITFTSATAPTVTATTGADGRFQAILRAADTYTATLTLPPNFTGACTVRTTVSELAIQDCGTAAGTESIDVAIAAAVTDADRWHDGLLFILEPHSVLGSGLTSRLEAVVPLVMRDPDTSRTGGAEIRTSMIRVANAGPLRTVACVDWFITDSDRDVTHSDKDRDCIDLNRGAVFNLAGDLAPSGMIGMAEVTSVDRDANGTLYGISDLQVTVTQEVINADNAVAGTNGLNTEDFFPQVTQTIVNPDGSITFVSSPSRHVVLPTVFKNYGGGAHKWDTVINACLTRGVGAAQPIVMRFIALGDTRGGPWDLTEFANPGGCVTVNLRDLSFLPDKSTFAVSATSTGTLVAPPPDAPDFRPGAFFASSVSYSTTGKLAVAQNAYNTPGGETTAGELTLYGGLVFKKYNSWNTGIGVVNFTEEGGSGSSNVTATFYDEGGRVVFTASDRISNERSIVWYLPALPAELPDGFRGSVVVTAPAGASSRARPFAFANHVNYDRRHAISYNLTRQNQFTGPEAFGAEPCAVLMCLWAADVEKQATSRAPTGPTTGIRLFNPQGAVADVEVRFIDSSGVEFVDARSRLTIPSFGTATFFLAHNDELPPFWTGSARITSTQDIVGVTNIVDYGVSGRDGSRAYNLPNETGKTQ